MAKSSSPKTKAAAQKSPAAFTGTETTAIAASPLNPSKYAPGQRNNEPGSADQEKELMKLFTSGIKDIYWAENQLVKALPKMANAAGDKKLAGAILDHLQQTSTQVERLEAVFELLDKEPQAQKCDAMEGLTKEAESVVESTLAGTAARDLGIILSCQKVEHYEIAAYTGLIGLATNLDLLDIADLLTQTLDEEQSSDQLLGNIADDIFSGSNNKAKKP